MDVPHAGPPRVALVDDHHLVGQTLRTALGELGLDVVLVDPDTQDLVGATAALAPALVLLDLDLGTRGDGLPLIGPLADTGLPVLVLTGDPDALRHAACLRAGAVGVVPKTASFDELHQSVVTALGGSPVTTAQERDHLLAMLRSHEADRARALEPFAELSPTEAEVLGLFVLGRTVEQVARARHVTVPTVRTQVRAILAKLDAESQVVAVARAREAGWTPPQERAPAPGPA